MAGTKAYSCARWKRGGRPALRETRPPWSEEYEAMKHEAGQHGYGGMTRTDSGKQGGDGEETREGETGRQKGVVSGTRK